MFCPHCGAQNNDSATICAECGQALKPSVVGVPQENPAPPPFGEPNAPAQTTPPPAASNPAAAARREGARPEVAPVIGTDENDDPEAIDTGATILLAVAAVIVPLLGVILYYAWRPTRPRTARQMLMFGLVNVLLLVILYRYAQ